MGRGREQLEALSNRQGGCRSASGRVQARAWLLEPRAGGGSGPSGAAGELKKPGLQRGTKWETKTLLFRVDGLREGCIIGRARPILAHPSDGELAAVLLV